MLHRISNNLNAARAPLRGRAMVYRWCIAFAALFAFGNERTARAETALERITSLRSGETVARGRFVRCATSFLRRSAF
jgi:hypothetical protein